MLVNPIDNIKLENAKFVRDTEYLKETAFDDVIDERVETAESQYVKESIEELEEAAIMVSKLPTLDDPITESAELDRILNATDNISFDEMIDLKNQ